MKYFDFDKLKHISENLEMLSLVVGVYLIIFSVAWVYNRFAK